MGSTRMVRPSENSDDEGEEERTFRIPAQQNKKPTVPSTKRETAEKAETVNSNPDAFSSLLSTLEKMLGRIEGALTNQSVSSVSQHGRGPSSNASPGRETRVCFYCKFPGHLIKDCRKRKSAMQSGTRGQFSASPGQQAESVVPVRSELTSGTAAHARPASN